MRTVRNHVLIAGGGNAALCAAIAAREQGANVTVLEHAGVQMRGGNTRHTRNLRAAHDAPVLTMTGSYSEQEFYDDLLNVTHGRTNENLARLMISKSLELPSWLQDRGVRFQPALSGTLSLERTNAFFLGGGKALLNALYKTARQLGVDVRYDCEVTGINVTDGRFKSVSCQQGSVSVNLTGDALIIASGGFQANVDWMKEIWGDAVENFIIRGTPYNRGTLLKVLMDEGALTVGEPSQCHAIAVDARAPRFDGGIVTRLDCVCFSIVVNREGQRFYDEGEDFWPKRYAIWGRMLASEPGQQGYAIMDSKVIDRFMPSLYPVIKADSPDELASVLGLPRQSLLETLGTYNSAVQDGRYDPSVLDECHTVDIEPAKSHWALRIDTPPFYAYPLRPGITFTYLGLKIDESARVLFADERPSPNIYAAGEVMAGNILGQGYCAGTGMTIGSVFGRIAGDHAARGEVV